MTRLCLICAKPVSLKTGLQCHNKCNHYVHYLCLGVSEVIINCIKSGTIAVLCSCKKCSLCEEEQGADDQVSSECSDTDSERDNCRDLLNCEDLPAVINLKMGPMRQINKVNRARKTTEYTSPSSIEGNCSCDSDVDDHDDDNCVDENDDNSCDEVNTKESSCCPCLGTIVANDITKVLTLNKHVASITKKLLTPYCNMRGKSTSTDNKGGGECKKCVVACEDRRKSKSKPEKKSIDKVVSNDEACECKIIALDLKLAYENECSAFPKNTNEQNNGVPSRLDKANMPIEHPLFAAPNAAATINMEKAIDKPFEHPPLASAPKPTPTYKDIAAAVPPEPPPLASEPKTDVPIRYDKETDVPGFQSNTLERNTAAIIYCDKGSDMQPELSPHASAQKTGVSLCLDKKNDKPPNYSPFALAQKPVALNSQDKNSVSSSESTMFVRQKMNDQSVLHVLESVSHTVKKLQNQLRHLICRMVSNDQTKYNFNNNMI